MKEITNLKNSVVIQRSFIAPFTKDKIFNYFINNNLSLIYTKISKGHKYFNLRNGSKLEVGSIIDCEEDASNQTIKHVYTVSEIIDGERIQYFSKPSQVKIKTPYKLIESTSNTFVYYDFEDITNESTKIRLTILIQFNKKFEYLFSLLFGGLAPWKEHATEEMIGLEECILTELK